MDDDTKNPPIIQDLARGLGYDPSKISTYIAFERGRSEVAWRSSKDTYANSWISFVKYEFAHELGHRIPHDGLSGLADTFNGHGNGVSNYANSGGDEDWAETVATLIYPGVQISANAGDHNIGPGVNARKKFARDYFARIRRNLGK